VWFADLISPVTPSYRNNGEFGEDDGTTNSSRDFLAAFHTETDVAIVVSNCDECLKSSPLTSPGLFLDRHDLEHLVLKGRAKEEVDDLGLLDWEREEVNFLQALDLEVLDQTAQFGDGHPFLISLLSSSPTTASASPSASATSTTASKTSSKSSTARST